MKRIINHWTGGGGTANATDKKHYHRLVQADGSVVEGKEAIADNIVTADGDYAAHTLNLNAGSIGVAMCGMRDAKEVPFSAGPSPINEKQFAALAVLNAELCREYGIPVTRRTVLFHAEVEPTLGVKQRQKWDVARLPWRSDIRGAVSVGDHFRKLVKESLRLMGGMPEVDDRPTLRMGNKSPRADVQALQTDLKALGYHNGRADGLFGKRTRAAVLAFQADAGIPTDGVVGPVTWAALNRAERRPLRSHSEAELREAGSRTIARADQGERGAKSTGAAVGGLGALQVGKEALDELAGAGGALEAAQAVLMNNWPVLLMIAVGAAVYWKGPQIMQAIRNVRIADAVTGANDSK